MVLCVANALVVVYACMTTYSFCYDWGYIACSVYSMQVWNTVVVVMSTGGVCSGLC